MNIYKITNLVNQKIYIGQDSHDNELYLGSGKLINVAILKYGRENFKKDILEVCNSKQELNDREIYWIKYFDATNKEIGYNISLGGDGGFLWDLDNYDEIREKISRYRTGKTISDSHKENIAKSINAIYPKKINKKVYKEPNKIQKGENNPFFGKSHTGDLYRFGKHRIGLTPTNALKIKRLDTCEIFNSLTEAGLAFNEPNKPSIGTITRAISAVCKGKLKHYKNINYEFI